MNYVAEAVGLAVLHLLWQGAIVAAILAATLALTRRTSSNTRYLFSCAALLAIVVCGVFTGIHSYQPREPLSIQAPATATAPSASTIDYAYVAPLTPDWNERAVASLMALEQWTRQIALAWLAGVLLLMTRLIVTWNRTRSIVDRSTRAASRELQAVAARLSARLHVGRAVRLIESAAVEVPSVVGWLRPVILLPMSSLTGLTPQQLEMVLAHELAHIRRHDFLVNALQSVAETFLFYHPAVWWISKQIRTERENCCDDLAVSTCGDALSYARALAQLEQLRAVPAPALAATGGSLFHRVRRLVTHGDGDTPIAITWTAAAILSAIALVFAISAIPVFGVVDDKDEMPPPKPKRPAAVRPAVAPAPSARPRPARTPRPGSLTVVAPSEDPDADPDFDFDYDITPTPLPPMNIDLNMPAMAMPAIAPMARSAMHSAMAVAPMAIAQAVRGGVAGALAEVDSDDDGNESDNVDETKKIGSSGPLTIDELIALRIQGVTPQYIDDMRKAGFTDLTLGELLSLRIQGVSPKYVESMRAAGVKITNAKDVVRLRIQGVSPEFVRSLSDAGYKNLSVRELVRLATAGVNADFIREMSKYRDKK